MKVAWLCPYPLDKIEPIPVEYRKTQDHPSTWIVTLSNALSGERDLELHIITEHANIGKSFYVLKNNIHFHLLRSGSAIPFLLRGYPHVFPLDVINCFKRSRSMLISKIKEINPRIVHGHGTERAYGMAAVESGYPHIVSIQGIMSRLAEVNVNYRYKRIAQLEKEVLRKGDNFIAKTNFARQFITKANPNANVYSVENIVHPVFFEISRDENIRDEIVFVGSLVPVKGVSEVIAAFSRFVRGNSCYKLIIIGGGDTRYLKYLQDMALDLGILERIRWLGFQTHYNIANVFNSAKLLLFPSKMDTSPNVVAEAMVAGLPVIASNVGGIPDMITHEETGCLIDQLTADNIYNAMKELCSNSELYKRISENAKREGRQRFSVKNAEKVAGVYKKVIEGRIIE